MTLAVYGQLQVVDAMDTYMAAMLEQTIDIKKKCNNILYIIFIYIMT